MSDLELSDAPANAPPDDATIESTLRRIVRDAIKKDEEITVRIARTRAENELELEDGFFKEGDWKDRSKNIISAAVEEPDSPVKEKPKAGRKRKSEEPLEKPKKRARKSPVVEEEEEEEEEEDEEEEEEVKPKPKPRAKAQAKKPAKKSPVIESDDEEEEEEDEVESKPKRKTKSKTSTPIVDSDSDEGEGKEETKPTPKPQSPAAGEDSTKPNGDSKPQAPEEEDDSDLSSLLDDPPPKKKAGRPKKSTSPSTTTTTKKKSTPATKPTPSADEEEIKRLQSQLLKCGIRKLWHRELAPHSTSKAKISHLKSLLADAGMTGRFSAEKARAIKEARELEAELEAARDFEEKFGTGGRGRRGLKGKGGKDDGKREEVESEGEGGEEEDGEQEVKKRPGGRLLPKGLVDFGDSGDDGSD